jgi:hypothetical protein
VAVADQPIVLDRRKSRVIVDHGRRSRYIARQNQRPASVQTLDKGEAETTRLRSRGSITNLACVYISHLVSSPAGHVVRASLRERAIGT